MKQALELGWGCVRAGGLPATASLMSGGGLGEGGWGAFNLRQQSLLWPLHLSYTTLPIPARSFWFTSINAMVQTLEQSGMNVEHGQLVRDHCKP